MNNYLFQSESVGRSHWITLCQRWFELLLFLCFSAEDISGSPTHRDAQRKRDRVMAVRERERLTQKSPGRQCVRSGGPGALWMAHAEWVPWRGDRAHWEQVTRGRECFCSAFGPLTHCPTSALAALKPNIFICGAVKGEGGAAVRIKSSSCWQLHLPLKGSYDRRTMSLRRPALGEGLSSVDTLGISRPGPLPPLAQDPLICQNYFFGPVRNVFHLRVQGCQLGNMWELSVVLLLVLSLWRREKIRQKCICRSCL